MPAPAPPHTHTHTPNDADIDTAPGDNDTEKDTEAREKEVEVKEGKEKESNKGRSVSFNRDVHVKRFGKPREARGAAAADLRREPFTHLSEQELIHEANRVLEQADSVTCTADHPPDKFFSLPHRRKFKEDRAGRRNSDDATDGKLGRSNSDVNSRKRRDRTSLSTLFRRAQRQRSPAEPVAVSARPRPGPGGALVKRSKSDVTDLKSNTTLNTQTKPIRKRSGSETEEFLKSLRNKKAQLSPIIESSPRDDYFKKTPPLEVYQKQKLSHKDSATSENQDKINPVEKPPRIKTPEKQEPRPPTRTKRGRSSDKELSPPIGETPKRKSEIKKTLLVDKIDSPKPKPVEVKDKIKESIRKIEENVYADRNMIHSSQQPPDKPPLTRGHTVDHMVRILREDQLSPPPKSHLISPQNGSNSNQPFSYIKPSVSPDGNLFVRNSPERVPSPVNRMTDRGVVYAQVTRGGDRATDRYHRESTPLKYSPARDKFGNLSDEDEGLGYEERYKYSKNRSYDDDYHNENDHITRGIKITDSPIKPKFREFRLTNFDDFEPTYANEYPSHKDESSDLIDKFRGRGDGMDTKRDVYEPEITKADLDFNELSHRRQLLESRLNARRNDREKVIVDEPITRYIMETDPIYEAEKKMKATERYVNETARYYRHTLERDGFAESSVIEDHKKYDSENNKKYATERRAFHKGPRDEVDGHDFIGRVEPRFKDNRRVIPPEPEYEPPSLESNAAKPVLTPDEYKDKKYRARKLTSSHDALTTGQRYKVRDEYFGKRKGHYASNPEIAQEREEEYANLPSKYGESYHNSLRRERGKQRRGSGELGRADRLVDSGIEHDFRKDSGELHGTAALLASERRHTEDSHAGAGEQVYANTDRPRHRAGSGGSADDTSRLGSRLDRYEKSPSTDDKLSAKPPKAKKLSGLEKMRQLFSRDSSKKSRKEKEEKPVRTRVLTSPEPLARRDSEYRRYTDPEPESEIIVKKLNYECAGDARRRSPREDPSYGREGERDDSPYRREGDRYRSPADRESDRETSYKHYEDRYERSAGASYQARRHARRARGSAERDSDRPSDAEERAAPPRHDSPALAERYRGRRRLATPPRDTPRATPTPSPPRRAAPPASWLKSLTRKKNKNVSAKVEKESLLTTEDESSLKVRPRAPAPAPAKNLRFFGDTDADSDANPHCAVGKSRSHPAGARRHPAGAALDARSRSLGSLRAPAAGAGKPPRDPAPDRARSRSGSKTLRPAARRPDRAPRAPRADLRRSANDLTASRHDDSRETKPRRRTPGAHSGESSTEGDSSHQSQRSVVYLHATTVGDIPDPARGAADAASVSSGAAHVRSSTRSFSLFAPWAPRARAPPPRGSPAPRALHYAQRPRGESLRKAASTRTLAESPAAAAAGLHKHKSSSHSTLSRPPHGGPAHGPPRGPPPPAGRGPARSASLHKDGDKKAGWFKLTRNKKPDLNTRVR